MRAPIHVMEECARRPEGVVTVVVQAEQPREFHGRPIRTALAVHDMVAAGILLHGDAELGHGRKLLCKAQVFQSWKQQFWPTHTNGRSTVDVHRRAYSTYRAALRLALVPAVVRQLTECAQSGAPPLAKAKLCRQGAGLLDSAEIARPTSGRLAWTFPPGKTTAMYWARSPEGEGEFVPRPSQQPAPLL